MVEWLAIELTVTDVEEHSHNLISDGSIILAFTWRTEWKSLKYNLDDWPAGQYFYSSWVWSRNASYLTLLLSLSEVVSFIQYNYFKISLNGLT